MRLGLLVVGVALCASAGAAPHAGKVVRIERGHKRLAGMPRYCAIVINPNDLQAYCYGKKPEIGDRITVLNYDHVIGTVLIQRTQPLQMCPQQDVGLWIAHVQLESGDLNLQSTGESIGLLDVVLDRRGHLMKVDHGFGDRRPDADGTLAVDTDGDSNPDLAFQQYPCDDQNNPVSNAPSGQCLEVWYATGRTFELLRTDRIMPSCT